MKRSYTLRLGLILSGLLLNNLVHAGIDVNAPKELKTFTESDFDSIHMEALKTHAVPLKILVPALILEGRSQGWIGKDSLDFKAVFKRAGLTYPDNMIYNNQAYPWKSDLLPAGLVQKKMNFGIKAGVKIVNLSCIACHSAYEYNSNGHKTNNLIIGAPSDTFNPEIYVESLYQGMKKVTNNWDLTFSLIKKIFPDTNLREKLLLKTFIRSQVNSYVKKQSVIDRGTPFINGGPGLTNGVASLKNVLGLDTFAGSGSGFTSIPSIGDRGFRTSLLYDGVYSVINKDQSRLVENVTSVELTDTATVVALFTIPTMGQTPKRALENAKFVINNLSPILATYKTPEFPGAINVEVARRGFDLYNKNCLQCHGQYEWNGSKKSKLISFPNVLIPQDEINSDPERWKAISPALVKNLYESVWSDFIQINENKGYVAPILEGLWASAPYLHNGSVPTLSQLLRPETRPAQFLVGNQSLDIINVGITASESFGSETYDTTLLGRGNHGHEKEFSGLSETDKDDLIEYLKTL